MTDNEIRIAVAEAMGWKHIFHHKWLREYGREGEDLWCELGGKSLDGDDMPLPNYSADLNACAKMRRTLTKDEREDFASCLEAVCSAGQLSMAALDPHGVTDYAELFDILDATALQQCEAFLRVKGLWKEDAT